jgi:hypothetical protein
MNDAIAIAFKVVAVGMSWLRVATSARVLDAYRIRSQHVRSVAKKNCVLARVQAENPTAESLLFRLRFLSG